MVVGTLPCTILHDSTTLFSIRYGLGTVLPYERAQANEDRKKWSVRPEIEPREDIMQMAITFMAVVGGMIFSLAIALLAEELIFGQVFRLFFASGKVGGQAGAAKAEPKR